MAKQNVYLIIDGSGSMSGVKHDVVKGINDFIDEQKNEAQTTGDDIVLSLTAFDGTVREVILQEDINLINHVTVKDTFFGGSTALYDAIGKTLSTAKNDKNDSNIVVIYTDGEENSSREFTFEEIEELIDDLQNDAWSFIYLGAEFADFRNNDGAALAMASTINTGKQNVNSTFANVSRTATYHRGLTQDARLDVATTVEGGLIAAAAGAGVADWYNDPLAQASKDTPKKTPKNKA